MWGIFVVLYIVFSILFTQFYKIVTFNSKNDGYTTVMLQLIAGFSILIFVPFFDFYFEYDWKMLSVLFLVCIIYSISDRINTTVRNGLEASLFGIIRQLATVFMILFGLIFFKEPFIITKILGALIIVFSNILIFFEKSQKKLNKFVILGILSNIIFSFALFLEINLSSHFNLAFYVSLTLIIPAVILIIFETIKFKNLVNEFKSSNKYSVLIAGLCWGLMSLVELKAYQLKDVTTVAPLCALAVIGNVFVGYTFLKEKNNLSKKLIAACLIIIGVILTNLQK